MTLLPLLLLQHRTISHSILGGVIFYKILEFVIPKLLNPAYVDPNIVVASIIIGFVSHIAADMITKEGVPLFFPFPFTIGFPPFKFLRITTGKFMENFIIFPSVVLLNLVRLIKS